MLFRNWIINANLERKIRGISHALFPKGVAKKSFIFQDMW
ncbi:hypothetical protein HMPREF9442_00246 [Paraprevotella xylaniphila YIT 11841]|uniref:Uncharacterized protein n=1 Tax=Paraprevotella xylaniphila YIT 11841 TaxID=762982 RepID=F3QQ09_9BACT|nr:hypothetical protein HMPREF9442_00246 [Paraprevotella xylaniphila YIT 11841]